MDIVEERPIKGAIVDIINKVKFKDEPVMLMGSAKLASQQNPSDIDLFSNISEEIAVPEIYTELRRILRNTEKSRTFYFIELKVQNIDESKTKFNNLKDFTKTAFLRAVDNLDYVKLDYVLYLDNIFTEMSIIYSFAKTDGDPNPLKALEDEVAEYKKEGNLYKAYKRIFSIYNIKGDKEAMVRLTRLFNSSIGQLYAQNSNLKAIKLLLEHYKDTETKRRAEINLKDIGLPPTAIDTLDEIIKSNDEKIQKETKDFFAKKHNNYFP